MRFKKFLIFLLIFIAGNYVLHVLLIGETPTGIKQINYLENNSCKIKKIPEGLQI